MLLQRGLVVWDNTIIIAETEAEYQSDAGSTKDTPKLALTGELWGSFVNIVENIDHNALYLKKIERI